MKKNIILFSFIFSLSVFFISCASTPKANTKDIDVESKDISFEENSESTNEEENDIENDAAEKEAQENINNEEANIEDVGESIVNKTEDIPFEEKIEEDILDELPEILEDENEESLQEDLYTEPEVKEEKNEEVDLITEKETQIEKVSVEKEELPLQELENIQNQQENNIAQIDQAQIDTQQEDTENALEADSEIDSDSEEGFETVEEEKEEIIPSRSITIPKNQFIDIVYPGKGWIYQGNIDSEGNIDSRNRNFVFGGRKLGGKDQSFTLRSRVPGTFLLHFFKNDMLTGEYIDDYLEVIVNDEVSDSQDHIEVPSYADFVPPPAKITAETIKENQKKQKLQEEQSSLSDNKEKRSSDSRSQEKSPKIENETEHSDSKISTIIQTTESTPNQNSPTIENSVPQRNENGTEREMNEDSKNTEQKEQKNYDFSKLSEDELLKTAKKYYDNKDYVSALKAITKFFDKATRNLDEGLYVQGQILEAKSSIQNIKDAIESYDLLVKNYPASTFWDKANKRSIFLKRFYINIR